MPFWTIKRESNIFDRIFAFSPNFKTISSPVEPRIAQENPGEHREPREAQGAPMRAHGIRKAEER